MMTSSASSRKASKSRALQRPCFRNTNSDNDYSGDVVFYRDAQKDLERLIGIQEKLYYGDLKIPKWLGPSKDCRMLKLPDDLKIYKDIAKDLDFLMNEICSQKSIPYTKELPLPNVTTSTDPNSLLKVAQLYNIDVRDISDSLETTSCSSRLEIQSISRKLERPLLKGRDTSRKWPSKPKKRDGEQSSFTNVPLFT